MCGAGNLSPQAIIDSAQTFLERIRQAAAAAQAARCVCGCGCGQATRVWLGLTGCEHACRAAFRALYAERRATWNGGSVRSRSASTRLPCAPTKSGYALEP